MRKMKKFLAVLLSSVLLFSLSQTVFASEDNYVNEMQDVIDDNNLDATVEELQQSERDELWNQYIKNSNGVNTLQSRLMQDEFWESDDIDDVAIQVTDNMNQDLRMYYYFKFYENASSEIVMAMFVYSPNSSGIFSIWSGKISGDSIEEYYKDVTDDPYPVKTRDFNTESFICSLGGTIACTLYSAMLFALVPVSIAAGLSCGAAFAYVCSYY